MVSSPPLLKTLKYFARYSYPLNLDELWIWQEESSLPPEEIKASVGGISQIESKNGLYYLSGHQGDVLIREKREAISRGKWLIARKIGNSLKSIPTVTAVFVTGALAMSNSPENDDIDMFIITKPYCLWVTRLLIDAYLSLLKIRRPVNIPEHESIRVTDKICDNLWLDTTHLVLSERNLFIAHELLQAKCLWDRGGVHRKLIASNLWAKEYLPVCYSEISIKLNQGKLYRENGLFIVFWPLNLILFTMQYLYMYSRKTTEKVGLNYAFFHPHQSV